MIEGKRLVRATITFSNFGHMKDCVPEPPLIRLLSATDGPEGRQYQHIVDTLPSPSSPDFEEMFNIVVPLMARKLLAHIMAGEQGK